MPIQYNVVQRPNPNDREVPGKFYPSLVATSHVEFEELAELVSQLSTVAVADTLAVLASLAEIVPRELINGKIINMGGFGSFWLSMNAEGKETAEDVSSQNIHRLRPRFRVGKRLQREMMKATYLRKEVNS